MLFFKNKGTRICWNMLWAFNKSGYLLKLVYFWPFITKLFLSVWWWSHLDIFGKETIEVGWGETQRLMISWMDRLLRIFNHYGYFWLSLSWKLSASQKQWFWFATIRVYHPDKAYISIGWLFRQWQSRLARTSGKMTRVAVPWTQKHSVPCLFLSNTFKYIQIIFELYVQLNIGPAGAEKRVEVLTT